MANIEGPVYQILVVDDEPTVCKAIQMMLTYYGHEVQIAEGGETALALFDKNYFDLVITDYMMPDIKGDVLVKLIKQRRPAQRILMATAFAEDFLIHGQPSGGVDHVVSKPFSLAELRAAIAKVMG